MNPSIPPLPTPPVGPTPPTTGQPASSGPISGTVGAFEALLRQPQHLASQMRGPEAPRLIQLLAWIALLGTLGYGLVLGSFSGGSQWMAAPLKAAAGLALSVLICLPSLYIFSCLSGSQAGWREVAGMVTGTSALMAVLLAGFAPVAWVFSQSTGSILMMGCLHLLFWMISIGFAFRFLDGAAAGQGGRRTGLRVWMMVFVLVMMQMTTTLRPLLGTSNTVLPAEKRFFLVHWAKCVDATAQAMD